ncbi:hypothetical protein VNO80_27119 [Phaseolus coccineus]|uniref:Uncharacterized protein n=1 Tax=Phaseolus coccineus TaxID=3886 RepID=A0AAN9LFY7_PHACN
MLLSIYPMCCYDLQEPEVLQEPFVALSSEEEDEVERAFSANQWTILVTHENSNIEITGEKFWCLRSTRWLNDEVNLFALLFVYPFVELLN